MKSKNWKLRTIVADPQIFEEEGKGGIEEK